MEVSLKKISSMGLNNKVLKIILKNLETFHHAKLCYGLHKFFIKNTSFSKKFKSIYKSFYYFKTLVIVLSKCFFDIFR
jgi:hypothetical protein